jgi:hypothetical protein
MREVIRLPAVEFFLHPTPFVEVADYTVVSVRGFFTPLNIPH